MNSQTVLSQGEGMTDNSSYGRLQSWTVTVSYTSLQLQSKISVEISVEGRERPHHERCGLLWAEAWDLCGLFAKRQKSQVLPLKPHPAAFLPCHLCSSELCFLGYFTMSRVPLFITQNLTVHLCFGMCKQCLFLQCLWDRVILGSFFPLEFPKRLN